MYRNRPRENKLSVSNYSTLDVGAEGVATLRKGQWVTKIP